MSGGLRILIGAATGLMTLLPSAAMATEALDGFWKDSDGEVILKIEQCGDARCGKVAWLRLPFGPDGQLLLDYRNPDPALRNRPVCGLQVISGFKPQEDGTWGDGNVYVSDLGMSFSGHAEVLSPTQVKVTGYVVLPLFGQSETWTRVDKPFDICWVKPPKPEAPAAAATNGGAAPAGDAKASPAPASAPLPADAATKPAPAAAPKPPSGAMLPDSFAKP